MADASTGDAGRIRIDTSYSSNAAGNYSDVSYWFYLLEWTQYNFSFSGGTSASVDRVGVGVLWSGSFAWDWRAGGLQNTLIASGSTRVYHNANGTNPGCTIQGNMGATGTSGAGGPASVAQGVALPTLTVLPGTPTGVTAIRVSDTQTQLNWSQSSASNGQPSTNTIQHNVNGAGWVDLVTVSATTVTTVSTAANRKTQYRVRGNNAAGSSAYSSASAAIYTTPAAPTDAVAIKNASLDIDISFTENVDYTEHEHEVWHGTVSGGVTTWDGSALTTLASGVTSYTHVAPNPSNVHVYRVRAKAGALLSSYATSNTVQLLVAPNAPTVPAMPAHADKASDLEFTWVHNPIDTTPQTAYEFQWSTNGGGSWSGTGKVTSVAQAYTVAANTHAANVALTTRVRTWGSATTGGAEGTGASDWSTTRTVTYKTVPVATITSPTDGEVLNDATLRVTVGFSQAEGASFVKTQVRLLQMATELELLEVAILAGITMATPLQNGEAYEVQARVQDSNGLWSDWASHDVTVVYLSPVTPAVTLTFLPDTGYGQVALSFPAPGVSEDEAATVTVTRTIQGQTETLVEDYPVEDLLTFLDTTAVVNGTNTYTIISKSALGAQSVVTDDLVTTECRRAYLSKGASFADVVVFGGNLTVDEALGVASDTVQAAGRVKPIGLYGVETDVQLKVKSFIFEGFGSTIPELRALLLLPGKACYRDASGRRIFGSVQGGVSYAKATRGELTFTLTETS